MKGRTPTADEKRHMDAVQAMGCIVCRLELSVFSPAEIHHTDGKTKPGAHKRVMPLCFRHHREGVCCDEYVSRHPFKAEFERRHGAEEELLNHVDVLLSQEGVA